MRNDDCEISSTRAKLNPGDDTGSLQDGGAAVDGPTACFQCMIKSSPAVRQQVAGENIG